MDFGANFPSLPPRISELYGANRSALRVGEAKAYQQDLNELECEEYAFMSTIQELVNRQAAVPIGVKFHREGAGNVVLQTHSQVTSDQIRSSSSEEEEDSDEEDDNEEQETTGRATIEREDAQQSGEDSFSPDVDTEDDSMELDEVHSPRNSRGF